MVLFDCIVSRFGALRGPKRETLSIVKIPLCRRRRWHFERDRETCVILHVECSRTIYTLRTFHGPRSGLQILIEPGEGFLPCRHGRVLIIILAGIVVEGVVCAVVDAFLERFAALLHRLLERGDGAVDTRIVPTILPKDCRVGGSDPARRAGHWAVV